MSGINYQELSDVDARTSDSSLMATTRALGDIVNRVDDMLHAVMDIMQQVPEIQRNVSLEHCKEVLELRDILIDDIETVKKFTQLKWNEVEYETDLHCSCRPRRGALELDNQHLFLRYQELLQVHQLMRRRCWRAESQVGKKVGIIFKQKGRNINNRMQDNYHIFHQKSDQQLLIQPNGLSTSPIVTKAKNSEAAEGDNPSSLNHRISPSWEAIKSNPLLQSVYVKSKELLGQVESDSNRGITPNINKNAQQLDREINAVLTTLSSTSILSEDDKDILRQLSSLTRSLSVHHQDR